MDFEITTREVPAHHFDREKTYFPFDKLGVKQGFDVPKEYRSKVNYQLNAKGKGLNKTQTDKEFRCYKSPKGEGYFQVIRIK